MQTQERGEEKQRRKEEDRKNSLLRGLHGLVAESVQLSLDLLQRLVQTLQIVRRQLDADGSVRLQQNATHTASGGEDSLSAQPPVDTCPPMVLVLSLCAFFSCDRVRTLSLAPSVLSPRLRMV
jgi:hypothetical protein